MAKRRAKKRRNTWLIILACIVVVGGGGAYYYFSQMRPRAMPVEESSELQTARARRGELILSATGAGTVIPSVEVEMGVETGGLLVALNVQAGDRVRAGDVLAAVDDLSYRRALSSAELNLAKAMLDLETTRQAHEELLEAADETEVLTARAALASAQQALADLLEPASEAEIAAARSEVSSAKEAYDDLVAGPDADEIERAQLNVNKAKNSLWSSQMSRDAQGTSRGKDTPQYDQAQVSVLNAEISVRIAEMELEALLEPASEVELAVARSKWLQAQERLDDLLAAPTAAEIANAEAKVAQAQDALDDLLAAADEDDVAASAERVRQAEMSVTQAQLALEVAQNDLNGVTLVAPIDGTILDVSAEVGERVGDNTPFITVADLNSPMLEIFVDEADMENIAVGYECEVVLDAMPDDVFKGRVTQVDPVLAREDGVDVIKGLVSLDADSFSKPEGLPMGLNATVDIIGGRAENAVLVPVEALRDLGDGDYAVFVVENGQPRLRVVEVGLQDYTYAEITSGLNGNETVSTGIVETR